MSTRIARRLRDEAGEGSTSFTSRGAGRGAEVTPAASRRGARLESPSTRLRRPAPIFHAFVRLRVREGSCSASAAAQRFINVDESPYAQVKAACAAVRRAAIHGDRDAPAADSVSEDRQSGVAPVFRTRCAPPFPLVPPTSSRQASARVRKVADPQLFTGIFCLGRDPLANLCSRRARRSIDDDQPPSTSFVRVLQFELTPERHALDDRTMDKARTRCEWCSGAPRGASTTGILLARADGRNISRASAVRHQFAVWPRHGLVPPRVDDSRRHGRCRDDQRGRHVRHPRRAPRPLRSRPSSSIDIAGNRRGPLPGTAHLDGSGEAGVKLRSQCCGKTRAPSVRASAAGGFAAVARQLEAARRSSPEAAIRSDDGHATNVQVDIDRRDPDAPYITEQPCA